MIDHGPRSEDKISDEEDSGNLNLGNLPFGEDSGKSLGRACNLVWVCHFMSVIWACNLFLLAIIHRYFTASTYHAHNRYSGC